MNERIGVRTALRVGDATVDIVGLEATEQSGLAGISRLPVTLKILLESLLRREDGHRVTAAHVRALAAWTHTRRGSDDEIPFHPERVLVPDSAGLPLLADLAAMRDAMKALGGDPQRVNPLIPLDLVIDHSLIVDVAGRVDAASVNMALEMERNAERYAFLRWTEQAFDDYRLIPPGNGILHQVNLELLAQVVRTLPQDDGPPLAVPDTLTGTDSHTPMINAMGVLGWGVGGIEVAAAMLGQPMQMRIPDVVGCRLVGRPQPGVTTTDVVLALTERLRQRGVVGAFVEFCGPGMAALTLAQRATLSNMAVEYGATVALFPVDRETLRYLQLTGRSAAQVALVDAYCRAQGLWWEAQSTEPLFTDVVEFDLATVEPSLAGPRRPQDRVSLAQVPASFRAALPTLVRPTAQSNAAPGPARDAGPERPGPDPGSEPGERAAAVGRPAPPTDSASRPLAHGDVVIAAITSCTHTSNPSVMMAAGLLARNAVARGLEVKPWVKTSLAPGSRIVTDYLVAAGLQEALDALGFQTVGYGCTTCMGNSGPLDERVARQIEEHGLVTAAVLSGNRNFEGRIHTQVRANYLASPPLVVAYALAGSVLVDLASAPLGTGRDGRPVCLRDIWPSDAEVEEVVAQTVTRELFVACHGRAFAGADQWASLPAATGELFAWAADSEYIKRPPFFAGQGRTPSPPGDIVGARALLMLGDSITTDHISPIGAIPIDSPAGRYLIERGVAPRDFNFYGARRVNHEVMIRGTFAHPRLRNELVPGIDGGVTRHLPDGANTSVYEAAMHYAADAVACVIVAGVEYGFGSARDWAAKGTRLLGVRAVIAESFERIHRANLVGMGVLPLEFAKGTTRKTLGLTGDEIYTVTGLADVAPGSEIACTIARPDGTEMTAPLRVRIDTAVEADWYRHGGVLNYVLLQLLEAGATAGRAT